MQIQNSDISIKTSVFKQKTTTDPKYFFLDEKGCLNEWPINKQKITYKFDKIKHGTSSVSADKKSVFVANYNGFVYQFDIRSHKFIYKFEEENFKRSFNSYSGYCTSSQA